MEAAAGFVLTPQQQSLLLAALNSNKQSPPFSTQMANGGSNSLPLSPNSAKASPNQENDFGSLEDSPLMDNLDYGFGPDSSFDFDFANESQGGGSGDNPGTVRSDSTDNDSPEKRAHPDNDDEDGASTSPNGAKRREGLDRVPKKPGRKPLTSEPTSKRKAQNRAAQRAFRERKEKHLKDLETKVSELQEASDTAQSENITLRAQIEGLTTELREYKQRLQLVAGTSRIPSGGYGKSPMKFGSSAVSSLNDINFQFEFPRFGMLPGPVSSKKGSKESPTSDYSSSKTSPEAASTSRGPTTAATSVGNGAGATANVVPALSMDDLGSLSTNFGTFANNSNGGSTSRTSIDSIQFSLGGATSSPSASSNSNMGPSSSCGTSPEPLTQSPMGFKPVDTMATIGEEDGVNMMNVADQGFGHFGSTINSTPNFDWLAQQNGGQFEPPLFSDYRDSQETFGDNTGFDDLFNDGFGTELFTPYVLADPQSSGNANVVEQPKKSLIAEIDAANNADDKPIPTDGDGTLNCTKLWDKIQNCPSVQSGDFDLDSLCSELQTKARCSGKGLVVHEQEFNALLNKYLGKSASEANKNSNNVALM